MDFSFPSPYLITAVKLVLGLIVSGLLMRFLYRTAARSSPGETGLGQRRSYMHRGILISSLGIAFGFSGLFFYGVSIGELGTWGLVAAIVALIGGILLLLGFHPVYDLVWTDEGVTGPVTLGYPPRRMHIRYDDITEVTFDGTTYCIKEELGRKLRWNTYYRGHHLLVHAIAESRPDLFVWEG